MQPAMSPVVATRDLAKKYKEHYAVNRVNLEVYPGDIFGLLGPNGAGKTTIIRMLLGLIKSTSGAVSLFGMDIQNHRAEILKRTSAIVEAPALYPHLSGYENLQVMGLTAGVRDKTKLRQAITRMGLESWMKVPFKNYSLGMKQRLCIAAALLTDPQLIILDEPTNGLDPSGIREVRDLMRQLSSEGRTILLCSHLLGEVEQVCNRVAILQQGTIIQQGVVSELLASRSFIKIKVEPQDMEAAWNVLRQNEPQRGFRVQNGYILAEGANQQGAVYNRLLAQAQIYAAEITPDNIGLEEYFVGITGGMPTVMGGMVQANYYPAPVPSVGYGVPAPTQNAGNYYPPPVPQPASSPGYNYPQPAPVPSPDGYNNPPPGNISPSFMAGNYLPPVPPAPPPGNNPPLAPAEPVNPRNEGGTPNA